jgi:hypothetical protein
MFTPSPKTPCAAHGRQNPLHELTVAKWCRNAVVCSSIQGGNSFVDAPRSCDEEDRNFARLSKPLRDLDGMGGRPEIEHDAVVVTQSHLCSGGSFVGNGSHAKPLSGEVWREARGTRIPPVEHQHRYWDKPR